MMLFAPNDQLQIVTNFKAINGNKSLIQPIIGVTFGLCKDTFFSGQLSTLICTQPANSFCKNVLAESNPASSHKKVTFSLGLEFQ